MIDMVGGTISNLKTIDLGINWLVSEVATERIKKDQLAVLSFFDNMYIPIASGSGIWHMIHIIVEKIENGHTFLNHEKQGDTLMGKNC